MPKEKSKKRGQFGLSEAELEQKLEDGVCALNDAVVEWYVRPLGGWLHQLLWLRALGRIRCQALSWVQ